MTVKTKTLEALGRMEPEAANDAARAIIRHFDGIEFGIEYLTLPTGGEIAYVNTGDTYNATLLHVDGEWVYSSCGDVYEAAEREYAEQREYTGQFYCACCGDYHTDA